MDSQEITLLGRWFEREAGALVLYTRQWLGSTEAEDAVQDVFVNLMGSRRWPENPKAWLYRAARFRALKGLRSERRRWQREARAIEDEAPQLEPHVGEAALDARQAQRALLQLPPEEREAVTLRIWGGLTLEEIAGVMGRSVPTVFRRYHAGLQKLREHLESPCTVRTH